MIRKCEAPPSTLFGLALRCTLLKQGYVTGFFWSNLVDDRWFPEPGHTPRSDEVAVLLAAVCEGGRMTNYTFVPWSEDEIRADSFVARSWAQFCLAPWVSTTGTWAHLT